MPVSLRQEWQALRDCPAGERFERRYRRARRRHDHDELVPRIARLILATVAFLAGVVTIFLPLPEIVFFAASGALLAAESLVLARFLDRAELRAARRWERFKHESGLTPTGVRLASLSAALGTLGLSGYFCYQAFLR
jgi:hypothetical protein